MASPRHKRELSLVNLKKSRSFYISLIFCATIFCLVAAMLVLTRIGKADAGIGQPVTLGPPQNLPVGAGPNSISHFTNDFAKAAFAIVNDGSDTVSIVQPVGFNEGFDQTTNYSLPAGAHPQSVAVGVRGSQFSTERFVVVADTGINKVSVLLRASTNTFQQPVNYDVGTAPHDVALGLITNDSIPDIATANFGSDNVTVLTGNTNGTFGNAASYSVSSKPRAIALGRFDNNLTTDIVTCNSDAGSGKVNVLLANAGTFLPAATYNVGSDPFDVAVADLNHDGKPDLVTANSGSNDVSILLNNGAGGFTAAAFYSAGVNPRSVAIQDLNRDGKLDLAVASTGNGLNLLLNNGDGTFSPPLNFAMGQSPISVVLGLFNGDGIPDVATANNGDGTISIRMNTTVPLLTFASPTPQTVSSKPHSIAAFNRFGRLGFAVTNNDPNDSGVTVLYKTALSFSAPTHYQLLTGSQPEQVVAGNLGQIGIPSLVIALPNANKVGILLGNSDDSFQSPVYKDVGTFPRSLALADFNADGNLDIAAANFGSGTISMLFGNADRSFQNAFTVANVLSANPEFIIAGDFNNDGKADVATCNSGPPDHNKVNVLLGNGNGTFQPVLTYTAGLNPQFMTTGDFNQDGKLDLAVSDGGENKVSVLLNTGGGVFQQPASHYAVGSHPNSISAGDFNLDGRTDLVVSNGQSRTFSALLNNGDGTFKNSLSFIVGLGPIGITAGDFNSDNKPDVVTANHDDGTLSLVLNTSPPPLIPAPANDNFANAEMLSGFSGQTLGTNLGATVENDEPPHNPFSSNFASVWYSWTAPASGGVTVDTFESSFDTVLAVYTGSSLPNLTKVVSNNDDLSPAADARSTSKVNFTAVSGTTYKIAVSGRSVQGDLSLNWTLLPPPANDNFADAQTISGTSGVVVRTNAGATKEEGEPNHADNPGGASIWYRWTAPSNGTFTFNTLSSKISCDTNLTGCGYDTLLAVYRGGTLQEISLDENLVAKNDNATPQAATSAVSFDAIAGTTYQIAVDSKGGAKSDIVLSWLLGSAQDASFTNAIEISGFFGNTTSEVGANGEIWFRWVAPAGGSVSFFSARFFSPSKPTFQFPSTLSVYSVSDQNTLSLIGTNVGPCQVTFGDRFCQSSNVDFSAVAQTVYAVQIVKPSESVGSATLSWNLSGAPPAPPANDNYAAARVISGFSSSLSFNNTNATKEPGEPNHGGDPGGHSLWFEWAAPASFQVTFSTSAFSSQTVFLGVYTGSSVSNLTSLAGGTSSVTFNAVKDTIYRIALDSQLQGFGSLRWNPSNAPPNDNFVNAQTIDGISGNLVGTNINSTVEIGEPAHAGSVSGQSIWYSWTAPQNGLFTFNTDGSDINTVLAVYSGSVINNLSPVVSSNNETSSFLSSRVTFFALAGQNYKIAVTSFSSGTIRLQWGFPRSIGGRVTNIRGVGIANILVSLDGDAKRTRATDAQGFYNFPDVPEGGVYVVTPATTSYTFDFTDRTYSPLTADITDANFVALTPVYSISGRITSGGVGVGNVTVNLSGTITTSVTTTPQGFYQFPDLTTNGSYTVTPASPLYTFSAFSSLKDRYFFPALNANYTGVDFTAAAVPKKLTVNSSNPNSGVSVSLTPTDSGGFGGGPTPLTRTYADSTVVTLTAPAVASGNNFQKWLRDGVDFADNQSATVPVTMNADHTMTAVYVTPTRKLTVASSNPNSGVDITVAPVDNNSQGSGSTQFTRTYNINSNVTLTAPATTGGNMFQKWQKDGIDYSTSVSTSVALDADYTMTAVFLTTAAQTPAGQNVSVQLNGVTVSFPNVTAAGTTTILPIDPAAAGQLPNGFQLTGASIAFDISTTAVVQPPISVCFGLPAITDATAFGQLRILHNENGALVDRTSSQDFATKTICAAVNSLSPFVLASTAQQLQLLLEESPDTPNQAAAVDSVLMVRDPFPVMSGTHLLIGPDLNTRVLIFVRNLQLAAGETPAAIVVHLVDSRNQSYDVPAEQLSTLSGFDFSQLTFPLPDALAPGSCTIEVRAHGQVSNIGTIRIRM